MFFASKKKIIELSAAQAKITADLQRSRIKFEREQHILGTILNSAKSGGYTSTFYSTSALNEHEVCFLKDLGYKVEKKEQVSYGDGLYYYTNNGTGPEMEDYAKHREMNKRVSVYHEVSWK